MTEWLATECLVRQSVIETVLQLGQAIDEDSDLYVLEIIPLLGHHTDEERRNLQADLLGWLFTGLCHLVTGFCIFST